MTKQIPIICMTTDDGFISDYIYAYPRLRKKGYMLTSYIMANYPDQHLPYYASWSHWKMLHERGWDIQCHSFNHERLSTLTDAELREDMEKQDQGFIDAGLPIPDHHAVPFGDIRDEQANIILEYRKTLRAGMYRTEHFDSNHDGAYNTYEQVKSRKFGVLGFDMQTESQFENFKTQVDKAIENNGIFVWYFHMVLPDGDPQSMGIYISYLEKALDYIEESGIRVMTITEMYDYVTSITN